MDAPTLERRIVTVLFADLVGFTSLSERLDAEDVASVQDAYFAMVRETVGRHGGRLEKFIGDAAVAAFGVPRTRDDDAERGVRAGLALIGAIESPGARLGLGEDLLQLRVGINTGEVAYAVDGPDVGRLTGDTMNVAARLQAAAEPGSVLVGETTYLAVAAAIELGRLVPLSLKGKHDPVRAAPAISVFAERSRDRAMGALHAPMLGRTDELAVLRRAAERTSRGDVERWTIVAPPGAGKSRLLDELHRSMGTGQALVRRLQLGPDLAAPYQPVAELIRLALDGEAPGAARLVAAGVGAARAEVLASELQALMTPVGPDPERVEPALLADARMQRFDAWLEALDALAGARLQIWLVEDVHWAGGDFLAFLDRAGGARSHAGRLIVATARPSLLDEVAGWVDDEKRISLDALAPAVAAEIVRALVGEALPERLVVAVAERSDGNPLFIEELLRTWASVGVLTADDEGGWRLAVEPEDIELPTTVQAIYAAQVDDLPAGARRIARHASVAGRRFPISALGALGVEETAAEQGLDVLQRRALIADLQREPLIGEAYGYRHALLRDAGYASLARVERARLHVRLAGWLEAVAGERWAAVAEVIGGHYASALEAMPALGSRVDAGLDRADVAALAAHWLERAAEQSLLLSAYDAGASLLRRSIELTDPDGRLDRARRLRRLGETLGVSAGIEDALRHLEEARGLFASELDGPEATVARDGYSTASVAASRLLLEQLRFRDGAALAAESLREIGGGEDPAAARLELARAWGDFFETNHPGPALPVIARALATARSAGDRELELEATQVRSIVLSETGAAAPDLYGELAAIAEELGRWPLVVTSLIGRMKLMFEGRMAEIGPVADEADRLADAHGLTESKAWIAFTRTESALQAGDWDAALRSGERALALVEEHGYTRAGVRTWFTLRPIARFRGDRGLMARAGLWFDALPSVPDSPYGRLMHAAIDLDVAWARGTAISPPAPDRLEEVWRLPYDDPSCVAARDRIFEAWLEAGMSEDVRAAITALGESAIEGSSQLLWGDLRLWTARLALHQDGVDTARVEPVAREALERLRSSDAPWWLGQALELLEAIGAASAEDRAEQEALADQLRGAHGG